MVTEFSMLSNGQPEPSSWKFKFWAKGSIYNVWIYQRLCNELDATKVQFFKQSTTGLNWEFFLFGWWPHDG